MGREAGQVFDDVINLIWESFSMKFENVCTTKEANFFFSSRWHFRKHLTKRILSSWKAQGLIEWRGQKWHIL